MVPIVQLVRASDCGSECRGFESHWAPRKRKSAWLSFFCPVGSRPTGFVIDEVACASKNPAQCKIPVVLDFLHHRHKACIASGSPLAQLAQLVLRSWLAYLPAPVPCTLQKIFSSRKKWSYDQNIRLFFDPDSVNHAKSHIFDSFREFQSKNRRVF